MGFELIAANNGWAMAITGAIIVLVGLSALALIISQLHKIVALFEKKQTLTTTVAHTLESQRLAAEADLLTDLSATAYIIKGLCPDLGSHFELMALYQCLEKDQIPHPHLTIRSLREAGILIAVGNGTFTWQSV